MGFLPIPDPIWLAYCRRKTDQTSQMLSEPGNSDPTIIPNVRVEGKGRKPPCGVKTDIVCGYMPGPLVGRLEGKERPVRRERRLG